MFIVQRHYFFPLTWNLKVACTDKLTIVLKHNISFVWSVKWLLNTVSIQIQIKLTKSIWEKIVTSGYEYYKDKKIKCCDFMTDIHSRHCSSRWPSQARFKNLITHFISSARIKQEFKTLLSY